MASTEFGGNRSVFSSSDANLPGIRERLAATRRLIGATRRLMLVAATTAVEPHEIRAVEQQLVDLTERLDRSTRTRPLRVALDEAELEKIRAGDSWEHFTFNPLGIPLQMRLVGDTMRAKVKLQPLHEGPPDLLHGGFSASLMDGLLGTLVQVHGLKAVTANLELQFRRGISVDARVDLGGKITRIDGRKVWVEGWIDLEGERCVEARALFVVVQGGLV